MKPTNALAGNPNPGAPSETNPDPNDPNNPTNVIYVPVGGTRNLSTFSGCTSQNDGIATCNNGVVTGDQVGDTVVTSQPNGTTTKVIVYDPSKTPGGNGNTVYVPLGGVAGVGSNQPCISQDISIATCNGGAVTGNKLGSTSVTDGGTKVNVVVYSPANPPVGFDSANAGNPDVYSDGGTLKPPLIKLGMLVNDLNCTFCHLEVHGDVGSVSTVPPFRHDSHGEVFGRWLVNGAFNAAQALDNPPLDQGIQVSSQVSQNYNNAGHELPVDANGQPTFPTIDFGGLAAQVQGSLSSPSGTSNTHSINKVAASNVLLVGTAAQPIQLHGDVLIQGDLVISGVYTGVGTIYATGNIYIPANLTAANPASFPYPDPNGGDYSAANMQALTDIQLGKDGLGLASAHNIFVADLENYMDSSNGPTGVNGLGGAAQYISLYDDTTAGPLLSPRASTGIENVYQWLPEGQYQNLYQSVTPCWTSSNRTLVAGHQWGERALNRIDGFLYAASAIGGLARATNWTINGGMIAQSMHIISGAGYDSIQANTPCAPSRINFDYRLRNGLPILGALAPFFPNP